MLYLLDANVLIDANRDYYPIERVPEFWDWLVEMGELGRVKIPLEIYEEIVLPPPPPSRPDVLVNWLTNHRDALLLEEQVRVDLVAHVTEQGYAGDLTDDEIEKNRTRPVSHRLRSCRCPEPVRGNERTA